MTSWSDPFPSEVLNRRTHPRARGGRRFDVAGFNKKFPDIKHKKSREISTLRIWYNNTLYSCLPKGARRATEVSLRDRQQPHGRAQCRVPDRRSRHELVAQAPETTGFLGRQHGLQRRVEPSLAPAPLPIAVCGLRRKLKRNQALSHAPGGELVQRRMALPVPDGGIIRAVGPGAGMKACGPFGSKDQTRRRLTGMKGRHSAARHRTGRDQTGRAQVSISSRNEVPIRARMMW